MVLTIAPAVLEHARQHGPAHQEGAREVDRDDLVPAAQRLLRRVGEPANARDVAQVGDGAQLCSGAVHGGRDPILVRHVADHRDRPAASFGRFGVDLGGHGGDGVCRDVQTGHRRTLRGQTTRRGSPDA